MNVQTSLLSLGIQIVEDENILAMDIREQLEILGYSVTGQASSGERAVELAGETKPDLVLMDIRLKSRMDGIEAARQIKEKYNIPVVYLTAYADQMTLERAKITEPFGYLIKPFDSRELSAVIQMAVYKHKTDSERIELQTQLFRAQKMEEIGRLTSGIAHDFNNVLTVIQGYSEMALLSIDKNLPLYDDLKQINMASLSAARLTRQLLMFCRKNPADPKLLKINDIVIDVQKLFQRVFGDNIEIKTDLAPDLWSTYSDEAHIEQIIVNLAVNAKEAMPDGGLINIQTKNIDDPTHPFQKGEEGDGNRNGRYISLQVSDTGDGIRQEDIDRIFEPFYSTKGLKMGTGLGLSVVHKIVNDMKGRIQVRSLPDSGTTFEIMLPATIESPEKKREISKPVPEMQGENKTILITEDDENIRAFIERLCIRYQLKTFTAASIRDAGIIFQREMKNIDLILTDLMLPDGNGLEMAGEFLKVKPGLAVMLMSGYVQERDDWTLMEKHGIRFVQKPFSATDLIRDIQEVLLAAAK